MAHRGARLCRRRTHATRCVPAGAPWCLRRRVARGVRQLSRRRRRSLSLAAPLGHLDLLWRYLPCHADLRAGIATSARGEPACPAAQPRPRDAGVAGLPRRDQPLPCVCANGVRRSERPHRELHGVVGLASLDPELRDDGIAVAALGAGRQRDATDWRSFMKPGSFPRWLSRLGAAALFALLISGAASAADVQVMISAGFYGVYAELGPAFERASGHRLVTTRGPSMGDSPEAIPARLARGETADVVIRDGAAADELGRRGLVRADSKVELARSLVGMVVRAGAAKPDIRTVDAFRATLLAAKSIAYSDSGSGTYLSTTL